MNLLFIKIDSVMSQTTSITTTTGMFTVFSDTTMAMRYVAAKFACFTKSGWLQKILK